MSRATRAQPFYCPYCGETEIRPGDEPGFHECSICDRRWSLSYRGMTGAVVS